MSDYSVLMSVYYKERPEFLRRAIESVMSQTILTNDFVIVCDGPLNDSLYKVLEEAKEKYKVLNIVQLEENGGLGNALSIGITKAKNEIVMRMDSDDVCVANRAELQLPLMEEYDLVGGHITEFENTEDNIIGCRKTPEKPEEIREFAKKRNPFNHPSVMFKKSVVLKAGNYQRFKFFEDYYLWIRILQITDKVYNIQEVLVNMRSGKEMRSRRAAKEAKKSIKEIRKIMYKMKMINWFQCIFYTLGQIIFLSLSPRLKERIYRKVLRD